MKIQVCKYEQNGICRNTKSPTFGIECSSLINRRTCSYEVLETIEQELTALGCLREAFAEVAPHITDVDVKRIYDVFAKKIYVYNCKIDEPASVTMQKPITPAHKASCGDVVHYDDVCDSDCWKFDSMSASGVINYTTVDNTLAVSFQKNEETGTVFLNR